MSKIYCTKCGGQNFKYQCVSCADTNPSVEMTNSEIKNCPFCGAEISDHFNDDKSEATHLIGNIACFLTGVILKKDAWNTRTPEPTKAENGLVEINENNLSALIDKWKKTCKVEFSVKDQCILETWILCDLGTPSITKEQLLAILPEYKYADEFDTASSSEVFKVIGFNIAINLMKQRIEELFK